MGKEVILEIIQIITRSSGRRIPSSKLISTQQIRRLQKNDEGDDNDKPEDAGDQFGGNKSKNNPKKN